MAEALDKPGKGEKAKMSDGSSEEEDKMREDDTYREEEEEEEEEDSDETEKKREKELTGRQDGWFVVRKAVVRKDLRKKHAMSLQGAIKDNNG